MARSKKHADIYDLKREKEKQQILTIQKQGLRDFWQFFNDLQ